MLNTACTSKVSARRFRSVLLSGFSLLGTALLPHLAHAAQFSVTDGSSQTTSGATYSAVSSATNGAAVYASGVNSVLNGNNLTLNSSIAGAIVVRASNLGKVILTGGTLTRTGNGTVVEADDNSTVQMDGVTLTANGNNNGWLAMAYGRGSLVSISNSTLSSGSTDNALQAQDGSFFLDHVTLTSSTAAIRTMCTLAGGVGCGTVTVNNSTLTTTGSSAYGINANIGSTTSLSNTNINTSGDYASGIWVVGGNYSPTSLYSSKITGDQVHIVTTGGNAHGVMATGAAGVVTSATLTNSTIKVAAAFGVYADQAGIIKMTGGSIEVTGAGGTAAIASAAGSQVTLDTVALKTSNDAAFGMRAHGGAVLSLANGSITTAGAQSHGLVATFTGKLTVSNSTVTTTGADAAVVYMLGTNTDTNLITFNNVQSSSAAGVGVLVRGGLNNTLALNDTTLTSTAGTLFDVRQRLVPGSNPPVADAANPGRLWATANHSTLTGASRPDDLSVINLTLENGSVWNVTTAAADNLLPVATGLALTSSVVSALGVSASTVAFAAPADDTDFKTLTVLGRYYTTDNAVLIMNTRLDAGGALSAQATDRLIVNGDVLGTTLVHVNPTATSVPAGTSLNGANLASEGISLIQVGGAANEGSFQLAGGYVALAGKPYQYRLYAYGPGSANGAADANQNLTTNTSGSQWDYRLQSAYVEPPPPPPVPDDCATTNTCPTPPAPPEPPAPAPQALVPQGAAYLTAANALFQAGQMDIANLHRRMGEQRGTPSQGTGDAWIRGYGGSLDYSSNRSASQYGFNSSIDYAAVQLGGDLFVARGTSGGTRVGLAASFGSLRFAPDQVDASKGRSDTYNFAGYATYLADAGWYVDGVLSFGLFDGDVRTNLRGKTADLSGTSFNASIEGGRPFALGVAGLVLEPQAQLIYQRLDFDSQNDVDNFRVDLGAADQLTGRIGVRLARPFQMDGGGVLTPYARVNVMYGFLDGDTIHLGGDAFRTGRAGTTLEVAAGGTAALTQNLSLYGEAGWLNNISDAGVSGWQATAGMRFAF